MADNERKRRSEEDMFPPVRTDKEVEPVIRVFFIVIEEYHKDYSLHTVKVFGIDGAGESASRIIKTVTSTKVNRNSAIGEVKDIIRSKYFPDAKVYEVDLKEF